MATWHQQNRTRRCGPVRHWHTTQWVVVTDPPGSMTTSMCFERREDAEAFLAKVPDSYILPPGGITSR